ncbi:MAG TPA: glycosyltransferase, partial [Bryobacteraceae bacterium]|nr:glycosyltransferase [Bryobacteraceae bacterium]
TSLGAEGLPVRSGEHLLLADSPEAFAEAVSRLLASPEERLRLGRAGRALYEKRFTREQGWKELARIGM